MLCILLPFTTISSLVLNDIICLFCLLLMFLLIKRKFVSVLSCVHLKFLSRRETLMWWKAQRVCVYVITRSISSRTKIPLISTSAKKKKKEDDARARERERESHKRKKSVSVRPIEIARCCIVIRRLNRNNTQEGREREKNRKKKKVVVRACMFVTLVRRAHILKEWR